MAKDPRGVCSPQQYEVQGSNAYRIPVRGGLKLGATIFRPKAKGRFPVLVWYDPYRNHGSGAISPMPKYFAERGYAFCYLASRGSGNSEGVSKDEYMTEETRDACDALKWMAGQDWCSGKAGMLGASYSGFTSLQVAAEAPPQLKAIAPAYFTDRRYTDDCHYKGGCLRGYYDMLSYGLNMVAANGLPPFADAVGEKWSAIWRERLEKSEPYLLKWLDHPFEDAYWARGSIAGRYHKIKAASMLIAGWNDGYPNPPLRIFEALKVPKKLLYGPWSHSYPDASHCGPRIDIYFELLRWWDCWLKDMDNGVKREPTVQTYIRTFEEPWPGRSEIRGSWRMARGLPKAKTQAWNLAAGAMSERPARAAGSSSVPYLPGASRNGGVWDGGSPYCQPGPQNADEAFAVNFTSEPLKRDLDIFGFPWITLYASSDAPVMPFAVRLTEVGPDGTSTLVTRGILNGARRGGMDKARALTPGKIERLRFHLECAGWKFTKGNRIRVSINGSDFPNVWPTPYKGTIGVHWGSALPTQIELPVWDGGEKPAFAFGPSPNPMRATGAGGRAWQIVHDVLEDQVRFLAGPEQEFGVSERDPATAWARARSVRTVEWSGIRARSEATGTLTSTAEAFTMNLALNVFLNDGLYFQKQWSSTVKRALM